MANPSYTYTLTNGTTADASQVMQNFNDILNGVTDGSKDISVNALTVAGTATLNGNVNFGNATADDLTFTGSAASNFISKTTNTYDLGSSSLAWKRGYFGTSVFSDLLVPLTSNGPVAITGAADGSSAAAGKVGEIISSTILSGSPVSLSTATYNDITSVSLTAGDWDISLLAIFSGGAITGTQTIVGLATTSGGTATGLALATNASQSPIMPTATTDSTLSHPLTTLSLSSTTTYYLKARITYTVGTATVYGKLVARRTR